VQPRPGVATGRADSGRPDLFSSAQDQGYVAGARPRNCASFSCTTHEIGTGTGGGPGPILDVGVLEVARVAQQQARRQIPSRKWFRPGQKRRRPSGLCA